MLHNTVILLALAGAGRAYSATVSPIPSHGLINELDIDFGDWAQAYDKASSFVAALTTAEKYSIITGGRISNSSLNFTALEFKDGSEGVQQDYFVSAFSQSSALAMTWDKDAIYAQAKAVADEFYGRGYQIVNGPTSEPLGRTPWGGRLGEAFGPDPYQNGITFGLSVSAYTKAGVIAGGKHFLLNEQETNRQSSGGTGGAGGGSSDVGMGGGPASGNGSSISNSVSGGDTMTTSVQGASSVARPSESISTSAPSSASSNSSNASSSSSSSGDSSNVAPYSSNADDRTIHEAYLWPFYDGVKAGMGAVMCAMTEVNGSASCENEDLLMGLLKTELGFPGMVYADVGGQKTALGSVTGGLDYGSSSTWSTDILDLMLSNGSLTNNRLDDMVIRNIIAWYYTGLSDGDQPETAESGEYRNVRANHTALIRENGAKSIVLLKNENGALPLKSPMTMSIFGANAGPVMGGPNTAFSITGSGPTFDGHLASGSGSGQVSFPYLITPLAAISSRASQDGTMVNWILNDTYTESSSSGMSLSFGSSTTANAPAISTYADGTEVCLCFINALAGEGEDRTELYNRDQDTLINTVASYCNNTIVVVSTTGVRLLDQWIEHENITAVLYSAPLGQESGNSIADVLYGDFNPSGRLTYTIAKNESDYPVEICETKQCNFTEGVYLDYRYFDKQNMTVRYPFGHGLSYTNFNYSDVKAIAVSRNLSVYPTGPLGVGGKLDLWDIVANVSVDVTNTGSIDGAEVAQLYITYPAVADQPLLQLRGFERVDLPAGTKNEVKFQLRRRDLSYWDVTAQQWALPRGTFELHVGSSSRDLKLHSSLIIYR
ncbi:hypothetical protein AAFC00_007343 [Neodothiora populina]|uniref:beta-glucosidase n=1 Tax=Neodothiora populina TaxID=2781224 RepID=A0ABR3PI77_9PEZI